VLVPLRALQLGAPVEIVGLIVGAAVWKTTPPRMYVVNLVPAVPAVGVPHVQPTPPAPAVKPVTPEPPRVAKPEPELPTRPRDLPVRQVPVRDTKPAPLPDMPARDLTPRELPQPDRTLPLRPPALTRPGEKEMPSVPRVEPLRTVQAPVPSAATTPAPQAAVRQTAPPPQLGQPTGSAQGSGALLITSQGDFPFTWYLQRVQAKVHERWAPPYSSQEGQTTVVVFEIMPNGRIARATVEKTSGNTSYDLAALRAVTEASPFPQLPVEFKEPLLRVHIGIQFSKRG
jgi:protein TonB